MKTHPILFSAPMVRAILDGTKTQTRRIVKPQPSDPSCPGVNAVWGYGTHSAGKHIGKFMLHAAFAEKGKRVDRYLPSPYGKPGDQLWVKETSRLMIGSEESVIQYRADMAIQDLPEGWYSNDPVLYRWIASQSDKPKQWRPSLLMPQRASRITLDVTGVRVERLNEITPVDCDAEGIERTTSHTRDGAGCLARIEDYRALWESINGPGSWHSNPFVWVIEFRKVVA